MAIIHQPREAPLGARQLIFPALIFLALIVLLLRLWYLQVVRSAELTAAAKASGEVTIERTAPRGLIVDRHGIPLAWLESDIVVLVQPDEALKHPDAIAEVARLLEISPDALTKEIEEELWRRHLYSPIFVGASIEAATAIAEGEPPGFRVETQPMRRYKDAEALAHVLGYVWTPNDADVERLEADGIEPAQYVGKNGVERVYESVLMGAPGVERLKVDAKGRPLQSLGLEPVQPGAKLKLGIDFHIQRMAMDALEGRRGAVVILDPRTGHVRCMVSSPTFDAGLFLGGISNADYQELVNDPAKPLFQRAAAGAYAPGSTFKIVTTLAAAMAGEWSPDERVFCPGYFQAGNRRFGCLSRHGAIAFEQAFAKSCNTYFAEMGTRAGKEKLWRATRAVGIGEGTGIDLPNESVGKYLSQDLINQRSDQRWYPGDTVNYSIGQGELLVTPIQMACIAAMVANGGYAYEPRIVAAVGGEPVHGERLLDIDMPGRFWQELQSAMLAATEYGTVSGLQITGIPYAAKTGSAENAGGEPHSWVVGYAPAENPEIAFAVLAENSGHGAEVAAPIARALIKAYFTGRDEKVEIQASPNASSESSRTSAASSDLPTDS